VGCNLKCFFCSLPFLSRPSPQNTPIEELSESEFVNRAVDLNVQAVSLFGGEPTLHHEYVAEVGRLCKENAIFTILPTNGYINPWLASSLAKTVSRPIVGIKGSASETLYTRMSADSQTVLEAAKTFWEANDETCLTDLVGPGLDAGRQEQERLANWIRNNISPDVSIIVQALAGAADTPGPFRPWVGGTKNAHDESYKAASTLARNGLTNVWIQDVYGIERGWLEPGKIGLIQVTGHGTGERR